MVYSWIAGSWRLARVLKTVSARRTEDCPGCTGGGRRCRL